MLLYNSDSFLRFLYDSDSLCQIGLRTLWVTSFLAAQAHHLLRRAQQLREQLQDTPPESCTCSKSQDHAVSSYFIMFYLCMFALNCHECKILVLREPGRCKESEHIGMPKYSHQIGGTNHGCWSARFSSIVLNFETEQSMNIYELQVLYQYCSLKFCLTTTRIIRSVCQAVIQAQTTNGTL